MRIRSALLASAIIPGALAFGVAPTGTADVGDCTTYDDGDTVDDTSDDIITCTEAQYLDCSAAIGGKYHDFFNVTTIPMSPEAPTGSFTGGAGCGYAEDPIFGATVQDTPFAMDFGTFYSTPVDTMTVELHDLGPHENLVYAANGTTVNLGVRISINGESPFGVEQNESASGVISESPFTLEIPVEAELSETGLSTAYVFTVTNILEDLPSLATADFSDIKVTIDFPGTPYPLGTLPPDNVAPVWGATEVPASIVVNGESRGVEVNALAFNNGA